MADAIDEHLQVVQAPEHFLHSLQRPQLGRALHTARFHVELERVTEFLQRDARGVQAIGEVHRSGFVDGLPERQCPPADARVERPTPGASRLAVLGVIELARGTVELADDPAKRFSSRFSWDFCTSFLANRTRGIADQSQGGLAEAAGFMQLGYQEEHDIRFPDTAEPPRHFAELVGELAGRLPLELHHGQQLAQPPGRHASPMDSADIAVFYAGQRAGETLETGAEEIVTSW
jgi:hypothetical protein